MPAVLAVSGSLAYQAHVLVAFAWLKRSVGWRFVSFQVFPLPPLPIQGRRGLSPIVFPLNSLFSVTGACFGGLGWWTGLMAWVVGWEGLWGVPPTWVWVVGFSPQILEHPTSICDTGVNNLFAFQGVLIFLTHRLL